MVLSFVLGAMNLLWMAVLTTMIVAEQRTPRRWHLNRCFGMVFIAWGVVLIVI
jgi:predicted metal-binding membrane protein